MANTISKLFRWRPVTAWGVVGIMIAVACALHSGLAIDVPSLFYVVGVILLVQGIVAHGVNDLADLEVDKIAPIEETGRQKVLVTGEMTRNQMLAVLCSAGLAAFLLVIFLAMRAGPYVFVFTTFMLYSVFGYSCKPLKLGWRPFSELTVVVPTIMMLILGVEYVAIGTVTPLAVVMGMSYGFFNASWFMYSRAQDYEADYKMGKMTTIGRYGLDSTSVFAAIYLTIACLLVIYYGLICINLYTAILVAVSVIGPTWIYMTQIQWADKYNYRLSPEICARLRMAGISMTVVYGVMASLAIGIGGLLWT
jgi:4-hydroxybenzoate polyprenyltransferase